MQALHKHDKVREDFRFQSILALERIISSRLPQRGIDFIIAGIFPQTVWMQMAMAYAIISDNQTCASKMPISPNRLFIPVIRSSLLTVEIMLAASLGSVLIGGAFAWSVCRASARVRWLGLMGMGLAAALPLYVHASGWEATWGKFGWLPMLDANVRSWSISGIVATAWIHAMAGSGISALILYWGATRWPTELLQAARLEVPRRTAWKGIGWPWISPAIVAAGCWSGLLVVTDMTVADLYSQRTLPDVVYQQFAIAPTLLPATMGSTIAITLTMVTIVYWRSQRSWVQPLWEESIRGNDHRDHSKGSTWAGSSLTVLICCCVLGLPLLGLLVKAGWQVSLLESGVSPRFSVMQVAETVFDAFPRFRNEFLWTGLVAGCVCSISVPVGYLLSRLRWFKAVGLGLAIVATIPAPVTALFVVWFFSQGWVPMGEVLYERSLLPMVLASLPKPLAATAGVFYMGHQMFPKTISEVARLDTASRWEIFRRIELPWLRGPLMLAMLVSILLSMADLSAGLLVAPPEVQTVAVRMFGLLHSGVRLQEAGLCLATLFIQGFLLVAWSFVRAWPTAR